MSTKLNQHISIAKYVVKCVHVSPLTRTQPLHSRLPPVCCPVVDMDHMQMKISLKVLKLKSLKSYNNQLFVYFAKFSMHFSEYYKQKVHLRVNYFSDFGCRSCEKNQIKILYLTLGDILNDDYLKAK